MSIWRGSSALMSWSLLWVMYASSASTSMTLPVSKTKSLISSFSKAPSGASYWSESKSPSYKNSSSPFCESKLI